MEIENYIDQFSPKVQEKLRYLRLEIKNLVPEACEVLSYGMPTFKLKRNLVHFAAYKQHIGFYPAPSAIEYFASELKNYKSSKGAIQFPIDEELPIDLIKRIVEFRIQEEINRT
jgi:uncharacterized protein YdhG (YjbR/CyaY superfamily)